VEWYQTHGFYVFDTVAFAPFQPFLWAVLPSAASTGLIELYWTWRLTKTSCTLFSAAQLGQKVAVLDYVEPSVKGKINVILTVHSIIISLTWTVKTFLLPSLGVEKQYACCDQSAWI
jgi:hypothetical protein